MKLIIGLGNPGDKYKNTRHNAGFMALDFIRADFGFEDFKLAEKHKSQISQGFIGSQKVMLVKPQTYMNLSGRAVQSLVSFYKLKPQDVIVIFDDVDIESGKLRVRSSGSAGGHNGIKSMIECLGSDEFIRIRIGVKPMNDFKGDLSSYVLGQLTDEEAGLMNQNIQKIPRLLDMLFGEGIEKVMQEFN